MATSAGLVVWRRVEQGIELFLVHPGGPFWARRDDGWWTIPKGGIEPGESALAAARREVREETGQSVDGPAVPLRPIRQKGGKKVVAFAVEGEIDPERLTSVEVRLERPPGSGRWLAFPEVDRGGWFGPEAARRKILPSQLPLLEEVLERFGG